MARRQTVMIFTVGLSMLCGLVVLWHFIASQRAEGQGIEKTEALLQGNESVQLASFVVNYQQRRVYCSDPECLRYIERCFRENSPTRFDDMITYTVYLQFVGGGRLDVRTDWSRGGFSLCMPGDRLLQDGGEPRAWVVFRQPVPGRVKEMIDFLNDDSGQAKGMVMILEAGTIRREADSSLRRP